jgi:uncharacterized protein
MACLSLSPSNWLGMKLFVWLDECFGYEELRMSAVVPRGNRVYFVAFTDRDSVRPVISLRYEERSEVKHYVENFF